jgi:hypothetical protein
MERTFNGERGSVLVKDGVIYATNGDKVEGGSPPVPVAQNKRLSAMVRKAGKDPSHFSMWGGKVVLTEIAEEAWKQTLAVLNELRANRPEKKIEGLQELRDALEEQNIYAKKFEEMMGDENNDGIHPPKKPTSDVSALKLKYPCAAAYIEAEHYELSAHPSKSALGEQARKAILDGADYEAVISRMKAEWLANAEQAVWNS